MQPGRNDHQVRRPPVHVAQELAEWDIVFEIKNVAKRLNFCRVVIKHQQHPGKREHDEKIERNSSHAPGILVAHRVAIDLCRMQMQEDV